jgi:transcriptional regulator with PAS, ATPase and Fis domain
MTGARRGIDAVAPRGALDAALRRKEREVVERALARADGNVAEAASKMGIRRTSLYRIMKRYSIAVPGRYRG